MRSCLPVVLLACASPLQADPRFEWPVACTLGDTCFIEDYVDHDPGPGSQDFTCGLNSRDAHKGTDIALPDFAVVEQGITVRAAAAGTVRAMRDGMADDRLMRGVTDQNACGNAVILRHADGWESWYCHLRQGSVTVHTGDHVAAGGALGQIGLSGETTHPHLHFSLYHDGTLVDPFAPDMDAACGTTQDTLWTDPPPYDRTLLRLAGFSTVVPDYDQLRGGTARRDSIRPGDSMVVYAELGFAEHGDIVTITATGPTGQVFEQTRVMKSPKVSQLPAFGKHAPTGGWPEGDYLGKITVTRQGRLVANRFAHVTVSR